MTTHPEEYDKLSGESLTWARLNGTTGNRFHLFNPAKGYQYTTAYCGAPLSSDEMRGAPLQENLPKAKACPLCIKNAILAGVFT